MKKFCNKITKQQWRVSVPNINGNIFKRSKTDDGDDEQSPPVVARIDDDESPTNRRANRNSSGCYDLEQAELAFDRSLSVPDAVYAETEMSASSSSTNSNAKADDAEAEEMAAVVDEEQEEERFEDARTSSGVNSSSKTSIDDEYATVDKTSANLVKSSASSTRNLNENNAQFVYDVPKISFSFFDAKRATHHDTATNDFDYDTVVSSKPVHKSELRIVLTAPPPDAAEDEASKSPGSSVYTDPEINFPVEQEPEQADRRVAAKESNRFSTMLKSGSDPTLRVAAAADDDADEDDGLYKVPKGASLKRNRLSMSLTDFDPEAETVVEALRSARSSIEHISCSQIIVQADAAERRPSIDNVVADDYCKTRSKLPMRLRRATFLRKPKSKAIDTWLSLKGKMNEMMTSATGTTSVAANDVDQQTDRPSINLEEMYKQSKDKCKRVLHNTGKMFKKRATTTTSSSRDEQPSKEGKKRLAIERVDDSQSRIVKNDAFFDRVAQTTTDGRRNSHDSNGRSESFDSFASEKNGGSATPSIASKKSKSLPERRDEFQSLRNAFVRRSKFYGNVEGQNGFDDIRRYVKQGGDFCKELSVILQERSEAELQYAKNLSKLSAKLSKACREGVGDLNESWRAVAVELENRAESHRALGTKILEEAARPLRTLNDNQHRIRKQAETAVDKTARNLADWRAAEAKSKKHSHTCARDNEKLQDSIYDSARLPRSTSLIHLAHLNHREKSATDKENAKLEGKRKKAEDAVKKADIEYYTLCVRAERARLEWESSVWRSSDTFQSLEDERLTNLKTVLNAYLHYNQELGPQLIETTDRLRVPVIDADPAKDLTTFVNLRQSSQQASEQLLPDFYCEHITLAMNRERRKQALVKLLQLIRQDIDRERKSKNGLENLSKAIKHTPNFGAEDSQQSVTEKLYHMKSMLTYLEGARYKLQNALAELDSRPRTGHPLAPHITVTRDKSGLQQSVLKVPQWLREQYVEPEIEKRSPLSEKSDRSSTVANRLATNEPDWNDRGTADGNSNQPDSDFDEFSSQDSLAPEEEDVDVGHDGAEIVDAGGTVQPISRCRALYSYTPNLPDELTLRPGDVLAVYRQQEDGWWLGECNGAVGIFPATYVETMKT